MRVLVTGGAGFIGSHIVDRLIDDGHEVIVLDALLEATHRSAPSYLNPHAEYVFADIRDRSSVASCVAGIDAVSHQAAMVGLGNGFVDATEYVSINDLGTTVLLGCLADDGFEGRVVLGGSMVVYGEGAYRCPEHGSVDAPGRTKQRLQAGDFEHECPRCGRDLAPTTISENARLHPHNVYAATKQQQESLVTLFGDQTGCGVTVLRYHNVYGPRMPRNTPYAGVSSIFLSRIEAGVPPLVFEDGLQLRDFVHVEDVAHANVLALGVSTSVAGTFNVASGEPHTILEMAKTLSSFSPTGLEPIITGEYRIGDVRHILASPERAQDVLGFSASVSFEQGLKRLTIDHATV